jgi:hypothetical protein
MSRGIYCLHLQSRRVCLKHSLKMVSIRLQSSHHRNLNRHYHKNLKYLDLYITQEIYDSLLQTVWPVQWKRQDTVNFFHACSGGGATNPDPSRYQKWSLFLFMHFSCFHNMFTFMPRGSFMETDKN